MKQIIILWLENNTMEMDFTDVLARSQGLNASVLGRSQIPRLERQLDQIDQESRRVLSSKSGAAGVSKLFSFSPAVPFCY